MPTLRIAVPNKGSLCDAAIGMLREAGYRQRRDPRELVLTDPENGVEFFYLRPRDVAVYVGAGTVDLGITGRDLLVDSAATAVELLPLGFARSTFRFAAPPEALTGVTDLAGQRVATAYPTLVAQHLDRAGVQPAAIVRLDGAVESAVQLGVADAIADVVETGSTLRAAGLATFGDPILHSEAILVRRPDLEIGDEVSVLTRRLAGVLTAHDWVVMDYVVRNCDLDQAIEITPGFESPTVSPLHEAGWSAVRVMVRRAGMNRVMDELYQVGARGIIVVSVLATRL